MFYFKTWGRGRVLLTIAYTARLCQRGVPFQSVSVKKCGFNEFKVTRGVPKINASYSLSIQVFYVFAQIKGYIKERQCFLLKLQEMGTIFFAKCMNPGVGCPCIKLCRVPHSKPSRTSETPITLLIAFQNVNYLNVTTYQ